MHWQQLLLNPDKADLDLSGTIGVCAPLVAVGVIAVWALIRRLGASGGGLSLESFLLGVPLALCALMLPDLVLYMVFRDAYTGSRASFSLTLGMVQLIVAGACVYVLRHHSWEMKASAPRVWTQLEPAKLGATAGIWMLAAPVIFLAIILSVALARVLGLPIEQQPVLHDLTSSRAPLSILGAYVMAVVSVPLAEEFAFRVVLFGGLRGILAGPAGKGPGGAAAFVLSIFVFVMVHGMWQPSMLYLALPLTVLSIFLTLLYTHTRSIWPGVMFHALHNGLVLTLQFTLG
jgi:membrane protease YdiL (CAAX protease family)